MDAVELSPAVDLQKSMMDDVREIYMFHAAEAEAIPLLAEQYFFHIWYELYSAMPPVQIKKLENTHMSCLRSMIGFIQENYASHIRLEDIARAGLVSISTCSSIFTELIHQPPIAYLLSYRLSEAQSLLYETNLPIGEIASQCGFSDQSYFTGKFREAFHITPRQYRKLSREN